MKKDIAIIGLSGKFPKSDTIDMFWENLMAEKEFIHFFSDEELKELGVSTEAIAKDDFIPAASFISETNFFDYPYFGYTLDEARIMNPQTRMMHQLVAEALEDAGMNLDNYKKKAGIFMGANRDLNWTLYAAMMKNLNVDGLTKEKLSNPNFMGSLIAYKLNFKGPCYFMDTACSTSLSAVHLACRSLLLNECGIAAVGGIRLLSKPINGYTYIEGSIMSNDGHNRSFDNKSSGTIGSDGAGVIVLKKLEEAQKDHDHIYAVIKGSAMNNDGKAKAGYTMPSVEGQAACIKLAQKIAGVVHTDITYIEAHGTGTIIGDPIEVEALNIAFNNDVNHSCAIGTVKSNMGHADEAAGIIGLIKTALSLKHKIIPASLHYETPNPTISFKEGPFSVNNQTREWVRNGDSPLTAGVSSLGIGGTNVHVILQEYEAPVRKKQDLPFHLIKFSADSETSLDVYEDKMLAFLKKNNEIAIADLAYTLQTGRKQLNFLNYYVVQSSAELAEKLKSSNKKSIVLSPKQHTVFMFPGQGSQYLSMGKDLFESCRQFREIMQTGFVYLENITGVSYGEILYNTLNSEDKKIDETFYTQPILYLFEYALARVLIEYGVKPDYMIGHSLGEFVAATIGEVMTLETGLRLISTRARLMAEVAEGDMVSIGVPRHEIPDDLLKQVSVAAQNTPESFVVSGTKEDIEGLKTKLKEKKIPHVELRTSHAFHSKMMKEILPELEKEFNSVELNAPNIPFISCSSGTFIKDDEATSTQYWLDHVLKTVHFDKGLQELISINRSLFIEVGPGRTLTGFFKKLENKSLDNHCEMMVRHPKETINDSNFFLKFLGNIAAHGYDIDWNKYYSEFDLQKISIPTYAFDLYDIPSKIEVDQTLLKNETVGLGRKDITEGLLTPSWKYVPAAHNDQTMFSNTMSYVFFLDESTFSIDLLEKLQDSGNDIIVIKKAKEFKIEDPSTLHVNAENKEDFFKVSEFLKSKKFEFDCIIYAWELSQNNSDLLKDSYQEYNMTFNTIRWITDCFYLETLERPVKMVLIDQLIHRVTGHENVKHINQHSGIFLNILTQETNNIFVSLIDIDETHCDGFTMDRIIEEFKTSKRFHSIAYRNSRRWEPYYQSLPINGDPEFHSPIIKQHGIYVITGALTDVEYTLTKHLQTVYKAHVTIFSGEPLYKWDIEKKKRYESLKTLSGTVSCIHVDVSNFESLSSELEIIEKQYGIIHGIIHIARNFNIADSELVYHLSEASLENHFLPRVNGLLNIEKFVSKRNIDFVKVVSTLSSFIGGITYGAYASAAAQMDQLVLSIGANNWSVINIDRVKEEAPSISFDELIKAFHYSFIHPNVRQTIVSKRDLNNPLESVQKESTVKSSFKINRKTVNTEYAAPRNDTESTIISLFEQIFGVTGLGVEDDFFELGGDSLKAVMLVNKLKKQTGISITMSDIFTVKTIREISKLIEESNWMREDDQPQEEIDSIVI